MEKGINRIQEKRLGLRLRWKAAEKWEEYVPFLILGAAALFLHYMVPGLMKNDRYYWNVLVTITGVKETQTEEAVQPAPEQTAQQPAPEQPAEQTNG